MKNQVNILALICEWSAQPNSSATAWNECRCYLCLCVTSRTHFFPQVRTFMGRRSLWRTVREWNQLWRIRMQMQSLLFRNRMWRNLFR